MTGEEADDSSRPTDWTEPREVKRTPIVAGAIITVAWVIFLVIYLVVRADHFHDLSANEFGDFLAGAFAPLAFLWLVLGFWQQGQELRHSAHALRLQGQELQHSVEQQRELVNVTREQLAFESQRLAQERAEMVQNAQPVLSLLPSGSLSNPPNNRIWRFRLFNYGRICTEVSVLSEGKTITATTSLSSDNPLEVSLDLPVNFVGSVPTTVVFRDQLLRRGEKHFLIERDVNQVWKVTEQETE